MQRLGVFEERLLTFVDSFWELFCMKVIYSEESDHLLRISTDKFSDRTMIFEIKKELTTTKKPRPVDVFRYSIFPHFLSIFSEF